ncbi:DEAD/DEAH box helicase family protein [Tritrichomonas foetus]|uniref:DEAD/DEAH box helicase family protein n=1 Tax=Tritrichomonas foetus TaxID=1144522 RepID=A0A1J4L676_9EUKA|nr:DEAD/DEAH box helicase family protein [Tritrichomonas foetus]|eukprot:OHT17516.1 DEAD/DEAH box helicase family protein [Tritrichomonas foetus]
MTEQPIESTNPTTATPNEEVKEVHSFVEFHLARPVIRAINEMGFVKPTVIQARTIKPILDGRDVCATAITGSGKSAAFLIPIIHKLMPYRGQPGPKALIMSPTRELCQQLHTVFEQLSKYARVSSALVIGGISAEEQKAALTPTPDIIFATPGRFVDQLFNSCTVTADHIKYFVLDEADRLLGRGFEAELTAINSKLPETHQTLLFSATMSDQIHRLINKVQKDSLKVAVDMFGELSPNLTQIFIKIKAEEKRLPTVIALCKNKCKNKTIIFFPTKQLAHHAALLFNYAGMHAAELHADLPQPDRQRSVQRFASGDVRILLASDLAARGLDIPDIMHVINYTVPNEIERYIHRVGRTARAGKTGTAISLIKEAHEKQVQKKMTKHATGPIQKMSVPAELFGQALEIVTKFDEKVQDDLRVEEEERVKRAQENELKRMKAILDVEEEIPTMTAAEKKKGKQQQQKWFDDDD